MKGIEKYQYSPGTVASVPPQVHFQIREGSNYKVVMKYGREEVISFSHFQALAPKLKHPEKYVFTTVNDMIVQIMDIRMVEPTEEKTEKEKQARKDKETAEKKEAEKKEYIAKRFSEYKTKILDKLYGEDGWTTMKFPKTTKLFEKNKDKKFVDFIEITRIRDDFTKLNPEYKKYLTN